jgi:hypothetical protein
VLSRASRSPHRVSGEDSVRIVLGVEDAVARCVEFGPAINPNPVWTATYERLGKFFDDLHEASQGFYDRLDQAVPGVPGLR